MKNYRAREKEGGAQEQGGEERGERGQGKGKGKGREQRWEGIRMQKKDLGSKGRCLEGQTAPSRGQRCFLSEDQVTDSGSAASSISHWGKKQNGVDWAKLEPSISPSTPQKNASCSTSWPQDSSLATTQFKDVQKNQENPEQGDPQLSQSLSLSQTGSLFWRGYDLHQYSTSSTDDVKRT